MICEVCKAKPATVFLTQIVDGQMQKINLCDGCSKEKGVEDPMGFALADLLLGLGASQEISRSGQTLRCPGCGFTQTEFKKTGRLGCARCYDTFSESLGSLLKAMHKGTSHIGKVPARLMKSLQVEQAFTHLKDQLDKAVAEEDYESAASLRDQIRDLEKKFEAGELP
jgi:protein arginine kinase activator